MMFRVGIGDEARPAGGGGQGASLLRRGPAGLWRLLKNALRFASRALGAAGSGRRGGTRRWRRPGSSDVRGRGARPRGWDRLRAPALKKRRPRNPASRACSRSRPCSWRSACSCARRVLFDYAGPGEAASAQPLPVGARRGVLGHLAPVLPRPPGRPPDPLLRLPVRVPGAHRRPGLGGRASSTAASGANFLVSGALLLVLGLLAVWAIGRIRGSNPWILAAAPALALYASLNWDLLGIALFALAILLFQRDRDAPARRRPRAGGVGEALPRRRPADRPRRAPGAGPPALGGVDRRDLRLGEPAGEPPLRAGPRRPSPDPRAAGRSSSPSPRPRPARATIWQPVLGHHADVARGAAVRGRPGGHRGARGARARATRTARIVPASTAGLLWLFATAKVYSPQYALWILAALAIDGVPVRLAVAFCVVDVLVFATTFGAAVPRRPALPRLPGRGSSGRSTAFASC